MQWVISPKLRRKSSEIYVCTVEVPFGTKSNSGIFHVRTYDVMYRTVYHLVLVRTYSGDFRRARELPDWELSNESNDFSARANFL